MIRFLLVVTLIVSARAAAGAEPTTRKLSRDEIRDRMLNLFIPTDGFAPNPKREAWVAPVRDPDNYPVVRDLIREILEDPARFGDTDDDRLARHGAMWLLAEIGAEPGTFSSLLLPLLSSSNRNTRWGAVRTLGATGTAQDAPALLPLLDDERGDVAYQALLALGKIGTARELSALRTWHDRVSKQETGLPEERKRLDGLMIRTYEDAIRQIEARAAAATRPATQPATRPAAPSP